MTTPSGPLLCSNRLRPCDPSDTLPVGALIESAPAINVKVAGVIAPAGSAVAPTSAANELRDEQEFTASKVLFWEAEKEPHSSYRHQWPFRRLSHPIEEGQVGEEAAF